MIQHVRECVRVCACGSVSVSKNDLGAAGAAVLADVLPRLQLLEHVGAFSNDFGTEGVELLAPALAKLPQLKHLM